MTEVIWLVKMKILYGLFRKSVPIPARYLGFMGGRMGPGRQPQDRPTRRMRPAPGVMVVAVVRADAIGSLRFGLRQTRRAPASSRGQEGD